MTLIGTVRPRDPDLSDDTALPDAHAAPVGQFPAIVRTWFDALAAAERPDNDGSLMAAHASARAYRARAKADNTRAAYRSAIRMWCAWW